VLCTLNYQLHEVLQYQDTVVAGFYGNRGEVDSEGRVLPWLKLSILGGGKTTRRRTTPGERTTGTDPFPRAAAPAVAG
jgi:hypothetical protein